MSPGTSSMVFIQYLTAVFDNIQDAITLISVEPDNTYRLLVANESFYRDGGHPPDSIGKTMRDISPSATYDKLVKHYDEVIKTKNIIAYTETYDGPAERRIYESKLIPVFNAVGECVHIACIARDVTELHIRREQLQTAAVALERLSQALRHS